MPRGRRKRSRWHRLDDSFCTVPIALLSFVTHPFVYSGVTDLHGNLATNL